MFTKLFYVNFELIESPFICTTYICGKLISLSLENMAIWLGLPNAGTEEYVQKKWPSQPLAIVTENDYRRWFSRDQPFAKLYVTFLPSLHRLAHMFINNILTPKDRIKTNLEYSGLLYLRHLISLDEIELHIPYIIIHHMKTAYMNSQHNLQYTHIIHKILDINDILIPGDFEMFSPTNLCLELTTLGWVEKGVNGIPHLVPNDRPINEWIWVDNALPNQYWDPNTTDARASSSAQGESSHPPQLDDNMVQKINWMAEQMGNMGTMMVNKEAC